MSVAPPPVLVVYRPRGYSLMFWAQVVCLGVFAAWVLLVVVIREGYGFGWFLIVLTGMMLVAGRAETAVFVSAAQDLLAIRNERGLVEVAWDDTTRVEIEEIKRWTIAMVVVRSSGERIVVDATRRRTFPFPIGVARIERFCLCLNGRGDCAEFAVGRDRQVK